jgi:hypothetical protein
MKQLTKYYKNGYDFQIFHRESDLAIAKGISRISGLENWEVIEIQSHNGMNMGSNWVEASEFAPSSSTWGAKGWTANSETQAWEIFNKKKVDK